MNEPMRVTLLGSRERLQRIIHVINGIDLVMEGVATHLPMLCRAVQFVAGNVMEFGMGRYSTPILHELCRDRKLTSVEDNIAWMGRFVKFMSDRHFIVYEKPMAKADIPDKLGVALVDCGIGNERLTLVRRLAAVTTCVVIHDTEDGGDGYEAAQHPFRYQYQYTAIWPYTTVLSDVFDVRELAA